MALRTKEQWETWLRNAKIPDAESPAYAATLVENRLDENCLSELTTDILNSLNITNIGDIIRIIKAAKGPQVDPPPSTSAHQMVSFPQRQEFKLPKLTIEMTAPQFRKFEYDWKVYKQQKYIPIVNLPGQIYNCCDEALQLHIVHAHQNWDELAEDVCLKHIKDKVTKHSNPAVYRMKFHNIIQEEGQTCEDFISKLRIAAVDCQFECSKCKNDESDARLRDQFIQGLSNSSLQTDILAKANTLKELGDVVNHAKSFDSALRDHVDIQTNNINNDSVLAARSSYQRNKQVSYNKNANSGCMHCGGERNHKTHKERAKHCPAFGKKCDNCHKYNHYTHLCLGKKTDNTALALVCEINELSHNNSVNAINVNNNEILMSLCPESFSKKSTLMKVFPDSGASICIAGPNHLLSLNFNVNNLHKCHKLVTTAGGHKLVCFGWLNMSFTVHNFSTTQKLFICNQIERIYLSKVACIELHILPSCFPHPVITPLSELSPHSLSSKPALAVSSLDEVDRLTSVPDDHSFSRSPPPSRPTQLPYPPTPENVGKLEQYIVEQFSSSAFNKAAPFPAMKDVPPAHIHLKKDAVPHARHVPIPVPSCWTKIAKEILDGQVKRGIIEVVPIGDPVFFCSHWLLVPKKNGNPRSVVDYQHLNSQCRRETHYCQPPFLLATQVPPNMKKTVLDAVDGYHAVELDEESKALTTFITPWGTYRYCRLPQGYLSSNDAYTRRYDELIKDVPRKVKCVDDVLLWDETIESAFFHTWDYLTLCANKGIVINKDKFKFCRDDVEFAGLQLSNNGISPAPALLSAIADFPVPKNITDARSWFGLVNQVSWAHATSSDMAPFRDLIKPKTKFYWDERLDKIFSKSKQQLIHQVEAGVRSFEVDRPTCLQTDWSKEGMGYLLLQQHCSCDVKLAPTCCKEGWHLVHAGSRFTNEAESRYSPTEGEATAVAWSLHKSRFFTLGCPNLIVSTNHRPLLGLLPDKELSNISNPRLLRIKEKTLMYKFQVVYNPGKWNKAADAVSRNPTLPAASSSLCSISPLDTPSLYPVPKPISSLGSLFGTNNDDICTESEDDITSLPYHSLAMLHGCDEHSDMQLVPSQLATHKKLEEACKQDRSHALLIETIGKGFPKTRQLLDPSLRDFWEVRDRLTVVGNFILLDNRLVIPLCYRKTVLSLLHSAHQGIASMKSRANSSVYWPGMGKDLRNTRYNCARCNSIAPSQPKEPIICTPDPDYPFQQVCADYLSLNGHSYLSVVDRYSGWLSIFHFEPHQSTSPNLITVCRDLFTAYGAPEVFGSDGGPQFTATSFQDFLKDWGVTHRLSSAFYPQSNGRAELGVKTAKRIIYDNTSADGSLDNDKAAQAIMQYRNTPLSVIGLSPAQILLHRQLRDQLPTHPSHYRLHKEWILAAQKREQLLSKRNIRLTERYNASAHLLPQLTPRTQVVIQNARKGHPRWHSTGTIVEVLPFRQYKVRLDGSGRVVLRNRRFLKQFSFSPNGYIPSPATAQDVAHSQSAPPASSLAQQPEQNSSDISPSSTPFTREMTSARDSHSDGNLTLPLRRLLPHNQPGLREPQHVLQTPQQTHSHFTRSSVNRPETYLLSILGY